MLLMDAHATVGAACWWSSEGDLGGWVAGGDLVEGGPEEATEVLVRREGPS